MNRACALARDQLPGYLHHRLTGIQSSNVRTHLDTCTDCWEHWNRFRWNAAVGHPLYNELQTFLGPRFQPYLDSSKALAAQWDRAAPVTTAEVRAFYATNDSYLYNLTIWEASGNRPPYAQTAPPTLRQANARTILDYGCGIGSDTITLRAHGFTVTPSELPSPHATFASWRFHQRDQPTAILDPATPAYADCLWIIDTLDHIPDIETALGTILDGAETAITENLATSQAHGSQRFHVRRPFEALRQTFAAHGLTPEPQTPAGHLMIWRRL